MNNQEIIKKYMSELGKKSAKQRAKKHDSEYYRQLANKRWEKSKLAKQKGEQK